MDVGEHFVYLSEQQRDVGMSQILTREIASTSDIGRILVGIDDHGDRHLLIPITPSQQLTPFSHKAISVSKRTLFGDSAMTDYLDVACSKPRLFLVFDRLLDEVVSRVISGAADPVAACLNTLDEWRQIIETASSQTAATTIAGLVGELALLESLARLDPIGSLTSWVGPEGVVHDFVSDENSAIEVKATTWKEGNRTSIHGLDQLDFSSRARLYLAVYHLRESPNAPSLDDRIDRLVNIGVSKVELIKKISKAGYVYESGTDADHRFECIGFKLWRVTDSFPGLKRCDLGPKLTAGVENVRFDIELVAAPPPLDEHQVEQVLASWSPHV
ncbi:PD-(D/E)XK motif protein [Dietzia cinnamea]|uniref:PD-(D/E)XK motif protein n=1 Tax=Dietzia cinnamea TaxID=321318 RepID=UPI0021A4FEFB|nr:PD-(D/E)XK motif protein [Dietzia cinnamea]MCT2140165.1 PD-(D/E)XK motif protein [Dietzia cinnamea]